LRESGKEETRELREAFVDLRRRGNQLLGRDMADLEIGEFDALEGIKARDIDVLKSPPFQWLLPAWIDPCNSADVVSKESRRLS
jgi:hypothetical protein